MTPVLHSPPSLVSCAATRSDLILPAELNADPDRRSCFPPEAGEREAILREVRREELQRDGPAESRVLGLVDHAHFAFAQLANVYEPLPPEQCDHTACHWPFRFSYRSVCRAMLLAPLHAGLPS